MPIAVKCGGCGHEMTVADTMAGKKGRCPECDAVLSIPSTRGSAGRRSGGSGTKQPGEPGYKRLTVLSTSVSLLGLLCLLGFTGLGVYTGILAFRYPNDFVCPVGVFDCLAATVAAEPVLSGIGFALGGLLLGALFFLILSAVGQTFLVLVSIERSLRELAGRPDRLED